MREFFGELAFLFLLALFITFFVAGFRPLGKIVTAHIPISGLREAAAA